MRDNGYVYLLLSFAFILMLIYGLWIKSSMEYLTRSSDYIVDSIRYDGLHDEDDGVLEELKQEKQDAGAH